MLFFYPLDFTFVCPTELIAFSDMTAAFAEHNCQVVACSVDSHFSHCGWNRAPWSVFDRPKGRFAPLGGKRSASGSFSRRGVTHPPSFPIR